LVREELAGLQLEQRRDEHEELPAGVEVEPALLGEVLAECDDDRRHVDVDQLQLLPQDEREQQVERPLERVEVEIELPRQHAGEVSDRGGCGPAGWPSSGPSAAATASRGSSRP